MGQVTIIIDKREYAITCGDGQEEHILELSRFLDEKARQLSASLGLVNENMKLAMLGLVLADELTELKSGNIRGTTTQDLEQLDAQIAQSVDSQTEKLINLVREIRSV